MGAPLHPSLSLSGNYVHIHPPSDNRQRRGYWKRCSDRLTDSGFVVHAPPASNTQSKLVPPKNAPAHVFLQGNGSFVAFSKPSDAESPTQIWKVSLSFHLSPSCLLTLLQVTRSAQRLLVSSNKSRGSRTSHRRHRQLQIPARVGSLAGVRVTRRRAGGLSCFRIRIAF
jgi:hypothetical protein